jgi:hypothetical protein
MLWLESAKTVMEFIGGLGGIYYLMTQRKQIGKVIHSIRSAIPNRSKLSDMNPKRVELLTYLLETRAPFKVIPAWQHMKAAEHPDYGPPSGEIFYPLEVEVAHEFRSVFQDETFDVVSQVPLPIETDGVLAIGSPVSNPYAAMYLGDPQRKFIRAQGSWWSAELAYRYEIDVSAPIVTRYQYGRLWEVPNTVLMETTGLPHTPRSRKEAGKRWIKTDYLLITRLPGQLKGGGDVIIIAGTHGIGTKATKLLLQNIDVKDLEAVREETNNAPYYQAVFEVPEIEHVHSELKSEPKLLIKSKVAKAVALSIRSAKC